MINSLLPEWPGGPADGRTGIGAVPPTAPLERILFREEWLA